MKPELEMLLEAYEMEKQKLLNSIESFMEDDEYEMVHFQNKALRKINHSLFVLNTLRDPLFPQKEQLRLKLANYQRAIEKGAENDADWKYQKTIFKKEVIQLRKELEELDSIVSATHPEDQVLDEAIFDVIEGNSKGFRLYIDADRDYFLEFRLKKDQSELLSIALFSNTGFENFPYQLSKISSLGFLPDFSGTFYEKIIEVKNFRSAHPVKIICSKLIFDYFLHYENRNVIEILPS